MLKQKLTQNYLKECMTYNPETGICIWKERPIKHFNDTKRFKAITNQRRWNTRYAGNTIKLQDKDGYICCSVMKTNYKAHRLAFLYMEGYFPEKDVDHIDQNPSNNMWSNLREVSRRCNLQNCRLSKNNTSGVTGIHRSKKNNKWLSKIMINRKEIHIGSFKQFTDAVIARYNEEQNNPNWTCSIESSAFKYLKEHNLI